VCWPSLDAVCSALTLTLTWYDGRGCKAALACVVRSKLGRSIQDLYNAFRASLPSSLFSLPPVRVLPPACASGRSPSPCAVPRLPAGSAFSLPTVHLTRPVWISVATRLAPGPAFLPLVYSCCGPDHAIPVCLCGRMDGQAITAQRSSSARAP